MYKHFFECQGIVVGGITKKNSLTLLRKKIRLPKDELINSMQKTIHKLELQMMANKPEDYEVLY